LGDDGEWQRDHHVPDLRKSGRKLAGDSTQGWWFAVAVHQLKNIRQFFGSIKDKVKVLSGLDVTFYGATEFSILDNNNYVLTFAEHE